jgi:(p)ppGpp synthase/HD superfamily hydrolase
MASLGERFDDAVVYATDVHRAQRRKASGVPYVSHLLGVCSLVLEDGGDEDEAIAALLHDAVEDQGGAPRLAEIEARYGDRVAAIVDACSDTDQQPKPSWRARKEAYIARLTDPATDASVLRVAAADKLHNARSVIADRRVLGEEIWARFNAPREEQLWYYRAVLEILQARSPGRLTSELASAVEELAR